RAARGPVRADEQVADDLVVERQVQTMPDVVDGRSAFERQLSRRRYREGTVAVVLELQQRIIHEHGRPLPADARPLERRQQGAGIDVRVDLELMLPGRGVGD